MSASAFPALPKRVIVDGRVVRITRAKLGRLAEGYARGGDYARDVVRLAPGQTRRSEKFAVFHELGHHVWERAGLGQFLSKKTEELVVSDLLDWILVMLRENPDLVEWLTEEV